MCVVVLWTAAAIGLAFQVAVNWPTRPVMSLICAIGFLAVISQLRITADRVPMGWEQRLPLDSERKWMFVQRDRSL
jgi:hypothetical protein